jgi:hypothetical protein
MTAITGEVGESRSRAVRFRPWLVSRRSLSSAVVKYHLPPRAAQDAVRIGTSSRLPRSHPRRYKSIDAGQAYTWQRVPRMCRAAAAQCDRILATARCSGL